MKRVAGLLTAAVAAAGTAILSGSMALDGLREAANPWYAGVCDVDATLFGLPFDCDSVNASAYAELFGVPLSVLGLGFYSALILLAGIALRTRGERSNDALGLLLTGAIFSILYALLLVVVQVLEIGAICPLCMLLYAGHVVVLGGALVALESKVGETLRNVLALLRRAHKAPVFYGPFALFLLVVAVFQIAAARLSATADPQLSVLKSRVGSAVRVDVAVAGDDAASGPADAAYLIVEFSDFMCPFCQRAAVEAHALEKEMPDSVRLVFKHFPLDTACNPHIGRNLHPGACDAAAAAVCAQRAGKFWQFHDLLFANQKGIFGGDLRDNLAASAEQIGLARGSFLDCLDAPDTRARVLEDIDAAHSIGVRGTPAFVVNGRAFFTEPLKLGAGSVRAARLAIDAGLLQQ
jgi:protein-disulfide isomerase